MLTSVIPIIIQVGFPSGSDGKESACHMGDSGSIPGSGRSSGEGNGNPLHYSYLENPMDRGAWQAAVHGLQSVRHDWATKRTVYLSLLLFICFGAFPHFRQTYLCEIICLLFFQIPIYRRSFSESESDHRYTNHQTDGKNKIYKIHRKSDPKQVNLYLWYYLNHLYIQCIKYINFKNRQFAQLMVKYIQVSCQMGLITEFDKTCPETLNFWKVWEYSSQPWNFRTVINSSFIK